MREELHRWLKRYLRRYREIMDNSREIRSGLEPSAPTVMFPFIPFLEPPAKSLHALFRPFLTLFLKPRADMLTILYEGDSFQDGDEFPYILAEPIKDGFFGTHSLYWNVRVQDVLKDLENKGIDFRLQYRKFVPVALLERVMAREEQWRSDGNGALFQMELLLMALRAIHSRQVVLDPPIPFAQHLVSYLDDVACSPRAASRIAALLEGVSRTLPDLLIKTPEGPLAISMSGSFTLEVELEAVLEFMRVLEAAPTLKALSTPLWEFLQKALQRRWLFPSLGLPRCVARLLLSAARRSVRLLPGKLEAPLKLLGSPFRIALVYGGLVVVAVLEDGCLARLELEKLPAVCAGKGAQEIWSELVAPSTSGARPWKFLHLLVAIPEIPALQAGHTRQARAGSLWYFLTQAHLALEPPALDIYPRNEFIVHLARKFLPDLVWNLGIPFLAA